MKTKWMLLFLLIATFAVSAGEEWEGDGDDLPLANLADNEQLKKSGDGVFSEMFGPDFQISGGTLRYLPERKAILIRDYATITIQGRRLRARNVIYFTEINRIYAEGEVSLDDPNGSFIICEQVYFDVRDGRGRARNVQLRKSNAPINTFDPVHENDATQTRPGVERNSRSPFVSEAGEDGGRMSKVRMNVFADDMRMISTKHFEAVNTWASPSNYAEPHWRITSQAIHVRPDEKVEAWHNYFKIGKVPVFYLPYLVYDLRYNWPYYRPSYGSDKRQGFYALNRLGWAFSNPVNANGEAIDENGQVVKRYFQLDTIFFDGDFRSSRGWGLGAETDYAVDLFGKGKGNLKGYWTKEIYTTAKEDHRRADEDVEFNANNWRGRPGFSPALYGNDDRYLIEWEHHHQLADKVDLRAQIHKFSDRDFYKEYFRDAWALDQQKKSNVNLRYLEDLFSTELTLQMRANEYRTETEYLPKWELSLPGAQLTEALPIYLTSNTSATFARKLSDDMLKRLDLITPTDRQKRHGETPVIGRVHEDLIATVPVDLQVMKVGFWGGGFLSGYSEGYNAEYFGNSRNAKFNAAAKWGVDFSSRFFGDLGERWKHIIEPKVSFINHETPVTNRADLYDLDAIDNYRKSRMVTFGLHQDFYKKDNHKERLFFTANVKTGIILDDKEAREFNHNNHLADVTFDASLYPTETWSLWGNCVYSPALSRVTNASGGSDFWFNKKMRMFVSHYYDSGFDSLNPNLRFGTSNISTIGIRTQLWERYSHYSLEYGLSYQWEGDAPAQQNDSHYMVGEIKKGMQKHRVSLIRDLDTFEASVTYAHDFTNNDWTVYASVTPKNWLGNKRAPDAATSVTLDQDWNRYAHPVPNRMQREDRTYNTATPAWK